MANRLPTYKPPYPRTRHVAGIVRPVVSVGNVLTMFAQTPGQYYDVQGGARSLAYEGLSRVCHDIVTPGYAAIRDQGAIINNPFTSVSCLCSHGGSGQMVQYTGPTKPWPYGTSYRNDVVSTLRTYDSRYLFGDVIPADGSVDVMALLSEINVDALLRASKTSAMSKVDQNLASGLVGIGELRATILGLLSPLASIRGFVSKSVKNGVWRWRRRPKGRKSLSAQATKAVANDYLAFYYGLMPFCRDIESYIDAYIKSGYQPERTTVRGGASDQVRTVTDVPIGTLAPGVSSYSHRFTHEVDVQVRSGILHELPPLTWQKVYGVRFSDFFDAAYQLAPWSFFIDYFSNLGKLINALTPRPGVKYLATWTTIRATIHDRAECTSSNTGGTWSHPRVNTEWADRVIEARVRTPEAPFSNVGFAFKTGDWSSKTKVLAVISLIIQQLLK